MARLHGADGGWKTKTKTKKEKGVWGLVSGRTARCPQHDCRKGQSARPPPILSYPGPSRSVHLLITQAQVGGEKSKRGEEATEEGSKQSRHAQKQVHGRLMTNKEARNSVCVVALAVYMCREGYDRYGRKRNVIWSAGHGQGSQRRRTTDDALFLFHAFIPPVVCVCVRVSNFQGLLVSPVASQSGLLACTAGWLPRRGRSRQVSGRASTWAFQSLQHPMFTIIIHTPPVCTYKLYNKICWCGCTSNFGGAVCCLSVRGDSSQGACACHLLSYTCFLPLPKGQCLKYKPYYDYW